MPQLHYGGGGVETAGPVFVILCPHPIVARRPPPPPRRSLQASPTLIPRPARGDTLGLLKRLVGDAASDRNPARPVTRPCDVVMLQFGCVGKLNGRTL